VKDKKRERKSLYIHALRPEQQGWSGPRRHKIMAAPYSFNQLLEMKKEVA